MAHPSRIGQTADLAAGLLFLYAAAVNLNDPDPWVWVPLYGAGAVGCAMHAAGRASWRSLLPMAVGYGLLAALVGAQGTEPSHPMKGFPQYGILREEIVRESLGLGLVALWALLAGAGSRRAEAAEEGVSASGAPDPRSG